MLKILKKGFKNTSIFPGSPYSFKENFGWLVRTLTRPSDNNDCNVEYISKHSLLNNIRPQYTISFIGDIMDMNSRDLIISENVKKFVKGSDFLIGNFEATITKEKVFNGKRHTPQIMDALKSLFSPEKTYFSTANNHAGDFGYDEFSNSVNLLIDKGFNVFGTEETPFLDIADDLRVIGGTQWSNRPCDYLVGIEDATQYLKQDSCNLLFPHWGYEMELYPRFETVWRGMELLNKFDAIVGHHSHCPQPVSSYPVGNANRLIAFSLGNFCDGKKMEMHNYGILVKVDIGINNMGEWQVGECNWTFLKTLTLSKNEFEVVTVDNFSEFSFSYRTIAEIFRKNEVFVDSTHEIAAIEIIN